VLRKDALYVTDGFLVEKGSGAVFGWRTAWVERSFYRFVSGLLGRARAISRSFLLFEAHSLTISRRKKLFAAWLGKLSR